MEGSTRSCCYLVPASPTPDLSLRPCCVGLLWAATRASAGLNCQLGRAGLPGSVPGTPVGPFTPHALPDGHGPLGQGRPSDFRPGPCTPHQQAARKAQALGPVIADMGMPSLRMAAAAATKIMHP